MSERVAFLLDENISFRIALALQEMGEPIRSVERHPSLGRGTPDEEILRFCAERRNTLITLDRRMKATPHLDALMREAGVGVFFVHSGRKAPPAPWTIFAMLVKHWIEMKRLAEDLEPPFARLVRPTGAIRTFR